MRNFPDIQPPVVIPERVDAPLADVERLPNGMELHVLNCSQNDVMRVSFVFRAGTSWQNVPFCASTTVNMLSEGTKSWTSHEISEQLDFYGSFFDVNIDRDYAVVTFCCLTKFFERTMEIAREVIFEPTFPQQELDIYTMKRKQQLILNRTKPDFVAREVFGNTLFGMEHPYGVSSAVECYDALTREDVVRFYDMVYRAENCFMVASGKISDEHRGVLRSMAAQFRSAGDAATRFFPEPKTEYEKYVPFEGAVQTSVRIGKMMFPRQHPDFIGLQVVSSVLGGYFGSRLIQNLRERHGYTYGVYSAMVNFDKAGYFAIATEVGQQFKDDAVREIYTEVERLCNEKVPQQELDIVKNIIVGEMMRVLDGPFGMADVTMENVQNGFDNSYIDYTVGRIRSMTPDNVLDLAQKYLGRDGFVTVLVG
ncbi:MAG: insulinase family protein [Tidjanibacter sp.]|nr:insulinase family protein [Tidjanibacter sp.]